MNNYDDIINKNQNKKANTFDKNEWAKKKQEERSNAYNLIDTTAIGIMRDSDKFKQYLDTQSKFNKYSVGNSLLILAQMPNATQLKDYESWKELGTFINKNAKGITILEPGESYTKSDGTISNSYNPKKVFDISQTNMKANIKNNNFDDKVMLKAFLHNCPVNVKAVESIFNTDKGAEWNKQDNTLYIRMGLDNPEIFNVVSTELAKINLDENKGIDIDVESLKAKCVSYLLCKKHNIDVSSYEFNNIPETFKNMDSNQIRNELGSIREATEDINNKINLYFEELSKEAKKKEQER